MSNELGKFLKTRIINAGMSQKDFAQQLDLSPTALIPGKSNRGKRQSPR